MTAAQQTDPEVTAYARQVREALADVPAARLEELLEDLEEHLVEVASETAGPLSERLGPPAEYAAELRRAAGLPAPEPANEELTGWRFDLRRYRDRYGDHPAVTAVREFLPELRPAWWVLRGWAAVAAVGVVFTGSRASLLPTLGLGVVGWLIALAAIAFSVRQGLRDRAAARPLSHRAAFANLALGVCVLVALAGVSSQQTSTEYYPVDSYSDPFPTTLTHEDGTPITNIVPYGPDGEPLTGVLLYDQDGRPIENLSTGTLDGGSVQRADVVPPRPANAYPQSQVVTTWDEYGNEVIEEFPAPTTEPAQPTAPTEAPAQDPTQDPAEAPAQDPADPTP